MNDTLRIIGVIIITIGLCVFFLGKQFILIRLFFKDRSMFSQLFWGAIISAIGLFVLYCSGIFNQ
ncbi:hypothetical protein GSH19_04820 [Lactobacillus sp. S2-2]|uniref:hypothetical protein n=1 Tax=Lactobacillus sp. S2-2 TaxID=2692917 RepID=UPI001F1B90BD|nr:hypothetical protein [Lactobacillus sp. S2-2]MCF6515474.1 hypothetical protein [Lactobacillus sp. S2-2]